MENIYPGVDRNRPIRNKPKHNRVLSDPYYDVLYYEECQTKKFLVVCCEIFAFFKAIFKFCTAKNTLKKINKASFANNWQ